MISKFVNTASAVSMKMETSAKVVRLKTWTSVFARMTTLVFSLFMTFSVSSCSAKKEPVEKSESVAIEPVKDLSKFQKATFAYGCFWCVEGAFESIKGVEEAISGYAGGEEQNPDYHWVGSGKTGHAESVEVYYDSTVISYETLLKVFFAAGDPTQVNGQGPDHGRQYRSIIFYRSEREKKIAEKMIADLNASKKYSDPISMEVVPFKKFWPAEDYHQNYIRLNPDNPYVQHESIPRIQRMQRQFPDLIKPERSLIK